MRSKDRAIYRDGDMWHCHDDRSFVMNGPTYQITNDEKTGEPVVTDGVDTWHVSNQDVNDIVNSGSGEWMDGRYVYEDNE